MKSGHGSKMSFIPGTYKHSKSKSPRGGGDSDVVGGDQPACAGESGVNVRIALRRFRCERLYPERRPDTIQPLPPAGGA